MTPNFKFAVFEDENTEVEFSVPGKYEVCSRCDGTGKHDHPAFENGLSCEDFDEDPDFREQYMRGTYDVPCSECHGSGNVLVADEKRLTAEEKKALELFEKNEAEAAQEKAWERRNRRLGIEY